MGHHRRRWMLHHRWASHRRWRTLTHWRTSHRRRSHIRRRPSARRRRNKTGSHPGSFFRLRVDKVGNPRHVIFGFFPSLRKRRYHRILRSHRLHVGLLRRGQSHRSPSPLIHVRLVVDLEVLAKFPASALLLATSGRVMCQVRIRVVVKEAGHGDGEKMDSTGTVVAVMVVDSSLRWG